MTGQIDADHRALSDLGVDPDWPPDLLGESVDHGKAEARALAKRLGREERIEGLGDDIRGHARAVVRDAERDVLARRQVAFACAPLVQPPVAGLDRDATTVRHGVARVDAEVSSAFSNWLGSTSVGQRPTAPTNSTGTAGPTVRRTRSTMPSTRRFTSVGLGSRVWRREKASRRCVRGRRALGRPLRRADVALHVGHPALEHARLHQFERTDDAGQHVVEVMRQAAGELATASIFCDWRNASSAAISACVREATRSSRVAFQVREFLGLAAALVDVGVGADPAQDGTVRAPDRFRPD